MKCLNFQVYISTHRSWSSVLNSWIKLPPKTRESTGVNTAWIQPTIRNNCKYTGRMYVHVTQEDYHSHALVRANDVALQNISFHHFMTSHACMRTHTHTHTTQLRNTHFVASSVATNTSLISYALQLIKTFVVKISSCDTLTCTSLSNSSE